MSELAFRKKSPRSKSRARRSRSAARTCKCKTNDGTRCKRKAVEDCSGYCAQHYKNDRHRCASLARKHIGPASRGMTPPSFPRSSKSRKSRKRKSRKSKSRRSH